MIAATGRLQSAPVTTPDPQSDAAGDTGEEQAEGPLRCDFCQRETPTVRRIALDGEYERLRTRHQVRYACPECSASKESGRAGA